MQRRLVGPGEVEEGNIDRLGIYCLCKVTE